MKFVHVSNMRWYAHYWAHNGPYRILYPNHIPGEVEVDWKKFDSKNIKSLQNLLNTLQESNIEEITASILQLIEAGLSLNAVARNILRYKTIREKNQKLYFKLIDKLSSKHKSLKTMIRTLSTMSSYYYNEFIVSKYIDAIWNDDVDKLQNLCSIPGFDINSVQLEKFVSNSESCKSFESNTLIEISAMFGSVNCFKYLLVNGATLDHIKKSEFLKHQIQSMMSFAIIGGNIEIVRIAEQNGYKTSNEDILHAIRFHRTELFEWLIENCNEKLPIGLVHECLLSEFYNGLEHFDKFVPDFAFQCACYTINYELAEFIIDNFDFEKAPGLAIVAQRNEVDFARFLLGKFSNDWRFINQRIVISDNKVTNIVNEIENIEMLKLFLKIPEINLNCLQKTFNFMDFGDQIIVNGNWRRGILVDAVSKNDIEKVRILLQNPSIDINMIYINSEICNGLQIYFENAIKEAIEQNNEDVIEMIFNDPRTDLNLRIGDFCPLVFAVCTKNRHAIEMLLEKKCFLYPYDWRMIHHKKFLRENSDLYSKLESVVDRTKSENEGIDDNDYKEYANINDPEIMSVVESK